MTPETRSYLAGEFGKATGHPVRWADEAVGGDFEGRETTLEIFDVPEDDQEKLFLELAPQRKQARQLLGERSLAAPVPYARGHVAPLPPSSKRGVAVNAYDAGAWTNLRPSAVLSPEFHAAFDRRSARPAAQRG